MTAAPLLIPATMLKHYGLHPVFWRACCTLLRTSLPLAPIHSTPALPWSNPPPLLGQLQLAHCSQAPHCCFISGMRAVQDGILGAIVIQEGGTANVGEPIAFVAETEADLDEAKSKAGGSATNGAAAPPKQEVNVLYSVIHSKGVPSCPPAGVDPASQDLVQESVTNGAADSTNVEVKRLLKKTPDQTSLLGRFERWPELQLSIPWL